MSFNAPLRAAGATDLLRYSRSTKKQVRPSGKLGEALQIDLPVLDARQLVGSGEVTPANTGGAFEHECGVTKVVAHATLFLAPILSRAAVQPHAFGVERHAPAAAPRAVVFLDQPREVEQRGFVERFHVEGGHGSLLT